MFVLIRIYAPQTADTAIAETSISYHWEYKYIVSLFFSKEKEKEKLAYKLQTIQTNVIYGEFKVQC